MGSWRTSSTTRSLLLGGVVVLVVALGVLAWRAGSNPAVDEVPTQPSGEPTATPTATAADPGTPTPTASSTPTPSLTPSTAPPTTSPAAAEVRAVWVHLFDDTLKTPASVEAMVDRAADAGANTLVVEVVRRQDAYYDSDVLPRTNDPDLAAGFDVLDHVLEQARARGLAVHAWVPVLSTHHRVYDDIPIPPGWVWTEHGPDAPEGDRWVTRLADGTWSDHLDPGVPAVRSHVAEVMAELATRYPVDGVHLDYVRYTSEDAGYHPTSLARYRQATGAGSTPAVNDAAWAAWRRDQVTALVEQVASAVRAAAPDVAVSAAVIAAGEGPTADRPFAATRAYTDYHQNWVDWAHEGLLDALFPMVYMDERTHGAWFAQWAGFLDWFADQVDPLLVGGQAGYLNTPANSLDQLARLQAGTDGVALYSYQQTSDAEPLDALLDRLAAGPWSEPAPAPLRR